MMRTDRNKKTKNGYRNGVGENRHPTAGQMRRRWNRAGLVARIALFAVALYAVLVAGRPPLGLKLGERSPWDYKARVSFTSTDVEQTRATRQQVALQEPPVFRLSPERWQSGLERAREVLEKGDREALRRALPEGVDAEVLEQVVSHLAKHAAALVQALREVEGVVLTARDNLNQPIVAEKTTDEVVLLTSEGEAQRVERSRLAPLSADSEPMVDALQPALSGLPSGAAEAARGIIVNLLEPQASLELERSREQAERAAAEGPVISKFIQEGRIILARGSEVRRQHIEDLQQERRAYWQSWEGRMVDVRRMAGVALLLAIVMVAAAESSRRYRPELLEKKANLLGFAVLTLALVAAARLSFVQDASLLWAPVPLMVMVMCLVYDQFLGLGVAVFFSLLVRMAYPGADMEFIVLLLGGVTAALVTGRVRTRSSLVRAGAFTGAVQFAAVWGLALVSPREAVEWPIWTSLPMGKSLVALVNGVASGFVISGVLPAIERAFGITTDIRLLEWSDPNQPLLQQLLLQAPGTYHHSMIVGSLAADAAEAIDANPLLARVSAYFHDVGKLKKPEYFGENMPAGSPNPHDELSPTMSTLIITAHPKDGAEMAERHGVPKPVRDIILQSHGTSVVKFFLDKAQEEGDEHAEVQERNFRYRLQKPRSREAAIVMLCDAVESAARSIESPSVGQLGNMVHQIVMARLHDGQLDESGLTITDLSKLETTLTHGLTAVFHSRVRYPGQDEIEQSYQETQQEQPTTEVGIAADAPGDQQQPDGA